MIATPNWKLLKILLSYFLYDRMNVENTRKFATELLRYGMRPNQLIDICGNNKPLTENQIYNLSCKLKKEDLPFERYTRSAVSTSTMQRAILSHFVAEYLNRATVTEAVDLPVLFVAWKATIGWVISHQIDSNPKLWHPKYINLGTFYEMATIASGIKASGYDKNVKRNSVHFAIERCPHCNCLYVGINTVQNISAVDCCFCQLFEAKMQEKFTN